MNTNGQFPNGNNRFPNGMPGQPGQNFQPNNTGMNAQGFNPQQPTGNVPPINRQMPPNPNAVPRQTGVVPPVNGQMPMGAQRGPINGPQQQRPVNSAPAQAVNPNMRQNIRPTVNIVPTQNVPVSQAARPTAGNNAKGTAVLPKIPNTMVVNPNVIVQDPNMRAGGQGNKNKKSSPLIAIFSILAVAIIAVGAAWIIKNKDKGTGSGNSSAGNQTENNGSGDIGKITVNDEKGDYTPDGQKHYVTLYYKPTFNVIDDKVYCHYKTGAMTSWTNEPGVAMEKSDDYKDKGCDYKLQIELKDEFDILSFCFNDGNGTWDNGKVAIDASYFVCEGTYLVSDLTLYVVECKGLDYKYEESKLKIYYSGFDEPYVHYAAEQGAWTELPGDKLLKTPVKEHVSKSFPFKYEITVGGAGVVAAVFNDNAGNWEKYGSGNFSFFEGTYLFQNKVYTRLLPIEKFPTE